MNEEDFQNEIDRLDELHGLTMAYFGHLSSMRSAAGCAPDSEIAGHFEEYPDSQEHLNPSYLAWRAIASASEHAGFAEHMRYVTSGGVVNRPHASLARVTFLGASKALYVLEPDHPEERRVRAAKLANQEAKDAQSMLEVWGTQTEVPAGFLGDLERQTAQLASSAAKILVDAGMKERTTVNDISMIKAVAPLVASHLEEAEARALMFWNRSSGISHARAWTWTTPFGVLPQFDFLETWSCPVTLLARAWELWNLRRGAPQFPHYPPDDWQPDRSRWGDPPQ
ncbi:hypothetical protein [Brevibacterium sp.]|uniref:hypothetical protein n=1 Tax=Brevibacterium sp. TaxID=1701 RepID=UPI002810E316|nr:hypothetical protein [Brevibacterium sp.]